MEAKNTSEGPLGVGTVNAIIPATYAQTGFAQSPHLSDA